MGKEKYYAYLRSENWQVIRQLAYDQCGGRCGTSHGMGCGCYLHGKFHVHHLSYKHLFHEQDNIDSVVALCPKCHEEIHERRITLKDLDDKINKM